MAALCGWLLMGGGCSRAPASKDEVLAVLREHCTREESRLNPKPLLKSKLQRLVQRPQKSVQVDERTQRWTYRFADGELVMHVIVETGSTWQDEDPLVFIDFKRLGAI
jgi:hypothetical protein